MITPAKARDDSIHRVLGRNWVASLVEGLGALGFFISALLVFGDDSGGFVEVVFEKFVG